MDTRIQYKGHLGVDHLIFDGGGGGGGCRIFRLLDIFFILPALQDFFLISMSLHDIFLIEI